MRGRGEGTAVEPAGPGGNKPRSGVRLVRPGRSWKAAGVSGTWGGVGVPRVPPRPAGPPPGGLSAVPQCLGLMCSAGSECTCESVRVCLGAWSSPRASSFSTLSSWESSGDQSGPETPFPARRTARDGGGPPRGSDGCAGRTPWGFTWLS